MTRTMDIEGIDGLRDGFAGEVLLPGQTGYDDARSLWNGDIDRHPAVIARCRSAADVAAALGFARARGLEVSVRGGGHASSGVAVVDDGLMIDLGPLDQVAVDPLRRVAQCGGGCRWADVDAATQQHGLALPGGMVSHTGIGGLCLGGGIGWLSRRHGLVIDNLVSAEVVLADGRIVRASRAEHPDLFWALRGGGGNFGVVTEFEFQLHPVGPQIHFGLLFWTLDQAGAALRIGRDTADALDRGFGLFMCALNAPPAPFVPESHHLAPGVAVMVVGFGSAEEHADALAGLRDVLPPAFELVMPLPYTGLQCMLDDAFPWGMLTYTRGLTFDVLTDEAIDVIAERLPGKTSPMSSLPMFLTGGAYGEVDDDGTAFGGRRGARCIMAMDMIAADPATLATDRTWARELWTALRPLVADSGGYVNAMYEDEQERVRASYGEAKYRRLAAIKSTYDPGNVFHRNANILPG